MRPIVLALLLPLCAGVARAQAEPRPFELSGDLTIGEDGVARMGPVRLSFAGGVGLKDEGVGGSSLAPDGHTAVVKGELLQDGTEVVLRVQHIDVRTGAARLQLQYHSGESKVRRDRDGLKVVEWDALAAETGGAAMVRLGRELARAGDQATYQVRGYLVSKGKGLGAVSFTPDRAMVVVSAVRLGQDGKPVPTVGRARIGVIGVVEQR